MLSEVFKTLGLLYRLQVYCLSGPYPFKISKGCFRQTTWSILEYLVLFVTNKMIVMMIVMMIMMASNYILYFTNFEMKFLHWKHFLCFEIRGISQWNHKEQMVSDDHSTYSFVATVTIISLQYIVLWVRMSLLRSETSNSLLFFSKSFNIMGFFSTIKPFSLTPNLFRGDTVSKIICN